KHFQQVRVRLANFATEKFHDAEHFAAAENRKGKRPVQPRPGGGKRARKVRVRHDVRNPGRSAAGPHTSGESEARGKGLLAGDGFELAQIDGGRVPKFQHAATPWRAAQPPRSRPCPSPRFRKSRARSSAWFPPAGSTPPRSASPRIE